MKKITVKEREFNIMESFSEISIGNFMDISTLYNKYNNNEIIEEEMMMMFLTIVSNITVSDIMKMDMDEVINIGTENLPNFKEDNIQRKEGRHFFLNGTNYGIVIPDKLSFGELVSIKLLEKNSKTIFDQWLNRLCIMVRPATSKQDEFGTIHWECEEFNGDMEILTKRKEILKSMPATNALWLIEAFPRGI